MKKCFNLFSALSLLIISLSNSNYAIANHKFISNNDYKIDPNWEIDLPVVSTYIFWNSNKEENFFLDYSLNDLYSFNFKDGKLNDYPSYVNKIDSSNFSVTAYNISQSGQYLAFGLKDNSNQIDVAIIDLSTLAQTILPVQSSDELMQISSLVIDNTGNIFYNLSAYQAITIINSYIYFYNNNLKTTTLLGTFNNNSTSDLQITADNYLFAINDARLFFIHQSQDGNWMPKEELLDFPDQVRLFNINYQTKNWYITTIDGAFFYGLMDNVIDSFFLYDEDDEYNLFGLSAVSANYYSVMLTKSAYEKYVWLYNVTDNDDYIPLSIDAQCVNFYINITDNSKQLMLFYNTTNNLQSSVASYYL